MIEYRIHPANDIGVNTGTVVPGSPSTYFDKVDDDPADDNTSYIQFGFSGVNLFGLNFNDVALIPAQAVILDVTVVWRMRASSSGAQARGGMQFGSVAFPGPVRDLNGDGVFHTFTEDFPLDPVTGISWTLARIKQAVFYHQAVTIPQAVPRPRFTQIYIAVFAADLAPRISASGAAVNVESSSGVTSNVRTASGVSLASQASAVVVSPVTATAVPVTQGGSGA